jgi:hypothetical protein
LAQHTLLTHKAAPTKYYSRSIKHDATGNHHGLYIFTKRRALLIAHAHKTQVQYTRKGQSKVINKVIGSVVTRRKFNLLRRAIGTPPNPILFSKIRICLSSALEALFLTTSVASQEHIVTILRPIATDLEMLRGPEARALAENRNHSERLGMVVDKVLLDMGQVKEATDSVEEQAKKDGYI